MDNTSFVILPVEKVREMIEIAVSGCLDKVLAALQPRHESESVDIEGALEFLNSNGYRIAKGQLYKETSAGNIPYHKFGHRLHFKISELREWAETRLVNGNSVGYYCNGKFNKRR
ncbi:DNA-binding protein [Muribaculaceae bacterium Isolate-004 (NCI)]|jgi:hypothetical protein|uniref:helix-turn-helix domain-containing protein n=1 Tax=Bacteroides acidifaciens TaxID=85831 RepID=UPI000FFE7425|nr:helix-turn-helix domain-containing protein [Bacteroides acidifaciens]RXE62936.1 DNA-binding protein [Muribaculaceae bacterium Isolate-004 (NCI)]RXE65000.1 DNA-binding protein [Muribaculaceae bacterium Isolate-001 (NCI)]